jgi:Rrf2 family transcriptional regulator, iron-sulfur cluster assembly transcription factor
MKITAIEEYGLRCMLILAKHKGEAALTLPEISAGEGLSIPYAGKLLMILKQAGLVKSVRGRKGGYALARPAQQIYLKEIFDCLGETVFAQGYCERHGGDFEACVHKGDCEVKHIWQGIDQFISSVFTKITLAELASGNANFSEMLAAKTSELVGAVSNGEKLPSQGK